MGRWPVEHRKNRKKPSTIIYNFIIFFPFPWAPHCEAVLRAGYHLGYKIVPLLSHYSTVAIRDLPLLLLASADIPIQFDSHIDI